MERCYSFGQAILGTTFAFALGLPILMYAANARAAEPTPAPFTTYWEGTTRARCGTLTTDHSRCGAVQNVKFTLIREDSRITGSYTCAYGNMNCRGGQTTGEITEGTLKGNQLAIAVRTPDRSVCRFTGILKRGEGKGSYYCKGGSQLDERGSWRIKQKE